MKGGVPRPGKAGLSSGETCGTDRLLAAFFGFVFAGAPPAQAHASRCVGVPALRPVKAVFLWYGTGPIVNGSEF